MRIITVANQKGGVGKSTLSSLLALTLKDKYKVAIIDTDPQQSLYKSIKNINKLLDKEVLSVYKSTVDSFMDELEEFKKYDVCVVDTMPSTDVSIVDLFSNSTLTLVPTGVSTLDIGAFLNTIKVLKAVKTNFKVVFNNIKNINDLNKVRKYLLDNKIIDEKNMADSYLFSRVAYSRLYENNLVIEDEKALFEFSQLIKELIKIKE